ncbi:MAG: hypothetical protein RIR48_1825 [Bacteroidota bacterium]|jgi:copper chaperone CopZ
MNLKFLILTLSAIMSFNNADAQISKAEIMATGLTCSMCSNAIYKQLKSLAEVDSVVIDLNTNTFVVHIKNGAAISPRILKERVEKAGFFVGSMIVSLQFDNTTIAENKRIEKDGLALVVLESQTQTLNGEIKAKIMDKGYVTQKEFKKLSKSLSSIPSYLEGNEDDYHVKIN